MRIKNIMLLICAAFVSACSNSNDEVAKTPFERYPPSDYYAYPGEICIDSMINERGNPFFVFEDSEHMRSFAELEDTFVIINGYLAPGPYYSPETNRRIMKNLKYKKEFNN